MGYTTDFDGKFEIKGGVNEKFRDYINDFSYTRRMKRDVERIKEIDPNWAEHCFDGNLGEEGEYYAPAFCGNCGQGMDDSILNYNYPPYTQPGLWCQWVISDDGRYLMHDGGEKFYNFKDWLLYLIENFFKPKGYVLNGTVYWYGEDIDDTGKIEVLDNKIRIYYKNITYGDVPTELN